MTSDDELIARVRENIEYCATSAALRDLDTLVRRLEEATKERNEEGLKRADGVPYTCRYFVSCPEPVTVIDHDDELGASPHCARHARSLLHPESQEETQ